MSAGWFSRVTGRSNRSRQAWRDNFNNGFAAGDLTGNINRQIAAEKQVAAERKASSTAKVVTPPKAVITAGPGVAGAQSQPATSVAKVGSGPGSAVVVAGPLEPEMQDSVTEIMIGGKVKANPWFSNADQWEERYGEPGDWLGGVVVGGADTVYNVGEGVGFNWDKAGRDFGNLPGVFAGGLVDLAGFLDRKRLEALPQRSGKGGKSYRTGGGF